MTSDAPSSDIQICNLALSHIGEPGIGDFTDDTDPANQCEIWYGQCVEQLLREYAWNFAQASTTLTAGGTGSFGYDDYYTLPANIMRLNWVGSSFDAWDRMTDYEISSITGDSLLHIDNSAGTLYVKYNQKVTNVALFDPLFVNLLALTLASNIAFPITKKAAICKRVDEKLARAIPKATSVDGQERPPRRVQKSRLLNARRFGRTGIYADTTVYDFS